MRARGQNETELLPLHESFLHITIAEHGYTSFTQFPTHFLPIFTSISRATLKDHSITGAITGYHKHDCCDVPPLFTFSISSTDESTAPTQKKRKVWHRGSKMSAYTRALQFPGISQYTKQIAKEMVLVICISVISVIPRDFPDFQLWPISVISAILRAMDKRETLRPTPKPPLPVRNAEPCNRAGQDGCVLGLGG